MSAGEIVSCTPPARAGERARWRCPCGVIWRYYANVGGMLGWRPDGWRMTRRRALKQHLGWLDECKLAIALTSTLSDADRSWLASVDPRGKT